MGYDDMLLNRHLGAIESAERIDEATVSWVLSGGGEMFFDEEEWPEIVRLAEDGPSTFEDQRVWDRVCETYMGDCSPY